MFTSSTRGPARRGVSERVAAFKQQESFTAEDSDVFLSEYDVQHFSQLVYHWLRSDVINVYEIAGLYDESSSLDLVDR